MRSTVAGAGRSTTSSTTGRSRSATTSRELSAETAPAAADSDLASAGGHGGVVSGDGVRHDVVAAVQRQGQGRARLDAYSPVKFGGRFSNVAVMPSVRSFDGSNAEFHTAT